MHLVLKYAGTVRGTSSNLNCSTRRTFAVQLVEQNLFALSLSLLLPVFVTNRPKSQEEENLQSTNRIQLVLGPHTLTTRRREFTNASVLLTVITKRLSTAFQTNELFTHQGAVSQRTTPEKVQA